MKASGIPEGWACAWAVNRGYTRRIETTVMTRVTLLAGMELPGEIISADAMER